MKKIFTLIAMAITAISANAQLPENVYPYADITWGDITWKNGNNICLGCIAFGKDRSEDRRASFG